MSNGNDGWTEVGAEEAQAAAEAAGAGFFQFKIHGDQFMGKLKAIVEGVKGTYGEETHYIFETPDGDKKINPTKDLKTRLSVVKRGDLVRITYVSDKDIGKTSPMKIFLVERRSGAAPAAKPAVKAGF
jgi:hypothetical protein